MNDRVAPLLEGLTAQQRSAVSAPADRPVLINAAAGSGKTHVLARRALYLQVAGRLNAERMLVLSFSRSGARAIGSRTRELAKKLGLRPVPAQTFHSFCLSLYRELVPRPEVVPLKPVPRRLWTEKAIWNSKPVNAVLAQAYGDLLLREPASQRKRQDPAAKIWDYSQVMDSIRAGHPDIDHVVLRPKDLDVDGVPSFLDLQDGSGILPTASIRRVFEGYLALLERKRMIDFAGMVSETLLSLRTDGEFCARVGATLDYLLVDEYQDTSRAQEEVLRLVLGPRTGFTVVGDNDQTIYSFNGSDVRNILEFDVRNAKIWPRSPTVILPIEENFRSTARILGVAARLIEINTERIPKTIRPSASPLKPPRCDYRRRNAQVVLAEVPDVPCALGCALDAVKRWLSEGVAPHEIAVLSRINPESDPEAALLDRLQAAARREGITVASPLLSRQVMRSLAHWVGTIIHRHGDMSLSEIEESGPEWRLDLPDELTPNIVRRAVADPLDRGLRTVAQWGRDLRLACANPNEVMSQPLDGLVLKTIHGAKGEEYRRVVVMHLGPGHLPHPKSKNLEEERRLLYVALTRGEEEVLVTGQEGNRFVLDLLNTAGADLMKISWFRALDESPARRSTGPAADDLSLRSLLGLGEDFDPAQAGAELDDGYQPAQATSVLSAFQKWAKKGGVS